MDRVPFDEVLPLRWKVILRKDGVNGAFIYAKVAVDALDWIDVKLFRFGEASFRFGGMNAIHRADREAGSVFHSDAWKRDDIGHWKAPG
jgi:hypothetical protein